MATHPDILAWRIPMDRGAWWATVHRVTKSETSLKQHSTISHPYTAIGKTIALTIWTFVGKVMCLLFNMPFPTPMELWKILKEMGTPEHLTCLLRNLYAGQEATVRTGHETTDWFQIQKGVRQGCILSPCFFNFYAEYIMRNAGLEETQAGIKIAGRNINNLDMQMTPPLWQKVKRNQKAY